MIRAMQRQWWLFRLRWILRGVDKFTHKNFEELSAYELIEVEWMRHKANYYLFELGITTEGELREALR